MLLILLNKTKIDGGERLPIYFLVMVSLSSKSLRSRITTTIESMQTMARTVITWKISFDFFWCSVFATLEVEWEFNSKSKKKEYQEYCYT